MCKILRIGLATGCMMLCITEVASASLIGDNVTAGHFAPDLSHVVLTLTNSGTVVTDGASDTMSLDVGFMDLYFVNIDASTINVTFADYNGYFTVPELNGFNGLVVSSLDDSSGNMLAGVIVNTNVPGWDISRLSFSDHSVAFNWNNLNPILNSDYYFTASLYFGSQPIPEPATILFFATGLIGIAVTHKRKKNECYYF